MSARPMVTIAITLYNYERYVREALESALAQDYEPLEILVLDNCSTDRSLEIVREYASDTRLRIVQHETNIGMTANHNAAWQMARGEYVVLLSADDLMLPGHVSRTMAFLHDHPDVDIVYTGYYLMGEDGGLRAFDHPGWVNVLQYDKRLELPEMLRFDNYITMPSLVVPKRFYEEAGGFDPSFKVAADFNLEMFWLQSGKRCAYLDVRSVAVRHHGENLSTDTYVSSGLQLREHVEIMNRYVTDANADAIAGRELAVRRMLEAKMHNLRAYPQTYAEVTADCAETIADIEKRLQAIAARGRSASCAHPRVSVICPSTGRPEFLERALRSLCAQTYEDWECVVVGDGGADAQTLVARLQDARLRFVRKTASRGPGAARNTGIRLIRGEIVCYLDEDNVYLSGHIKGLVSALDRDGADVAISGADFVLEKNAQILHREPLYAPHGAGEILKRSAVSLNAVAHRVRCFETAGAFNEALGLLEDWEFLLRLVLRSGNVSYCAQPTAEVRARSGFAAQLLLERWPQYGASLQAIYNAYARNVDATVVAAWREQNERLAHAHRLMQAPLDDANTVAAARLLAGVNA